MRYEDIVVGQVCTMDRMVSTSDIHWFAAVSGDRNTIHYNHEYARERGFDFPIVYGGVEIAYVSGLIGNKLPGNGAVWIKSSFTFVMPVYENDTITLMAKVHRKFDDLRQIELMVDIYNEKGDVLTYGTCLIKCTE
jgi:acyl dehydratase